MLRLFRMIALAEGVSTILLFLVAMPLKYIFDYPNLIRPVGWTHGILFIAYMLAMIPGMWGKGFSGWAWLRTFLAAFFPFGTFWNDRYLHPGRPALG